ncbi:MAG: aminotransferase class I/II-fold pyridoxal phosphate-dependent enzyme [Solirubrobacteraceae bacterium]
MSDGVDDQATDALGMGADEMRRLGYWVVDRVVEHITQGPDGPVIRTGDPDELRSLIGGPVPRERGDAEAALQTLLDAVLSQMQHGDHPRYFARVPGPSSFAGVLGDWLGTGYNAIAASWGGGSGPAAVELVVLEWLRQLVGLPAGGEGVILSGGSVSNLSALAAARAVTGPGVAYLSDQAHSSLVRGLRTLGFGEELIRILPSDDGFRLTAQTVADAVARDRADGHTPRFVIASAGTTNTGAVDELEAIAAVCAAGNLWFHIDGAYGAPAALCAPGRAALAGLQLADSLVLDPHKWLFAPYDAGVLLIRRAGVLERAFGMRPEYLADVQSADGRVDFGQLSPELTRRARALKLWMIFETYGLDAIAAAIERGITLAEHAQRLIDTDDYWRCVTPAQLGIVTFTHPGWGPAEHAERVAALSADGYAAITSTNLRGTPALRLCTINPRTTEDEIAETLARLRARQDGR